MRQHRRCVRRRDIATAIFGVLCVYCPRDRLFVWRPEFYQSSTCRPRRYLFQRPVFLASWPFLFRSGPPAVSHAAHERMMPASIALPRRPPWRTSAGRVYLFQRAGRWVATSEVRTSSSTSKSLNSFRMHLYYHGAPDIRYRRKAGARSSQIRPL